MTVVTKEKTRDRQAWMGLLARAEAADLARLWARYGAVPAHDLLRAPEIGGVMLRGRMGAVGDAFNMGEMSVTTPMSKAAAATRRCKPPSLMP